MNNTLRGQIAEYIITKATGAKLPAIRVEWNSVDVMTPKDIKIEVKSAAYFQSWRQDKPSKISFNIKKHVLGIMKQISVKKLRVVVPMYMSFVFLPIRTETPLTLLICHSGSFISFQQPLLIPVWEIKKRSGSRG